ncbi:hypothetical protein [Arthrobacter sp.]|uniref:hypothetical protein n=1 Tax=Arthrobacter sp. TaxID=1667 RepID=UPI003A8DE4D1
MKVLTAPRQAPAWAHPIEDAESRDPGDTYAEGPRIQSGAITGSLAWQAHTGPTILLQLLGQDERIEFLGGLNIDAARAAEHVLNELIRFTDTNTNK